MGQHCTGNFLAQCWLKQIKKTLNNIFLCKVVYGLWVNITQLTFLCNFDTGRSRKHYICYFPAKTCMCALRQLCTSNFFVQYCLRRIWTTLTRQYSYAMLSQHGQYNVVQVILHIKVVCQPQTNIAQVKTLCNVILDTLDNNVLEKNTVQCCLNTLGT